MKMVDGEKERERTRRLATGQRTCETDRSQKQTERMNPNRSTQNLLNIQNIIQFRIGIYKTITQFYCSYQIATHVYAHAFTIFIRFLEELSKFFGLCTLFPCSVSHIKISIVKKCVKLLWMCVCALRALKRVLVLSVLSAKTFIVCRAFFFILFRLHFRDYIINVDMLLCVVCVWECIHIHIHRRTRSFSHIRIHTDTYSHHKTKCTYENEECLWHEQRAYGCHYLCGEETERSAENERQYVRRKWLEWENKRYKNVREASAPKTEQEIEKMKTRHENTKRVNLW